MTFVAPENTPNVILRPKGYHKWLNHQIKQVGRETTALSAALVKLKLVRDYIICAHCNCW